MPSDKFFPTDHDTGARIVIDSVHEAVHAGRAYSFHVENLTATAATVMDVHYRTGDKEVHIAAERQAVGGRVQTILYENPIVATAGTVFISYFNRNRCYPDTNSMVLRSNSTFSTVGTRINTSQILATATNQQKGTSSLRDVVEWVMKPNTDYLARTTFYADIIYTLDAVFYETHEEE